MAQKRIVMLEDDIQGGVATATLRFAFDGTEYEIDLNEKNAAKMRQSFTFYADHARKIRAGSSRGRSVASPSSRSATVVDNAAVRAWAASNGVKLSSRGRIPGTVVEQYRAAGN